MIDFLIVCWKKYLKKPCFIGHTLSQKNATMIEKKELLKKISAIEQSEESVIAIYSNHIQHVLRYSTLGKDVQAKILDMLQKLNSDLQEHKLTTNQLIESIETSGKNVF